MMRASATGLLLSASVSAAFAVHTSVRLADASVRFDGTRWQASASINSIHFAPQGEAARTLDPVELHLVRDDAPCIALARRALQFGAYDTTALLPAPISIAGVNGERFAAHTMCRNATPQGVVACVKVGPRTYLLQSVQVGCGGRNPFSGIDPTAEIASGIKFTGR